MKKEKENKQKNIGNITFVYHLMNYSLILRTGVTYSKLVLLLILSACVCVCVLGCVCLRVHVCMHAVCDREGPVITLFNNPPVIVSTNWKPTC